MILCAERFDRKQHLSSLPGLGHLSNSCAARELHLPSGDWAQRQTHLRGFGTMTLFPNRHGRRLIGRAKTTTSQGE
jgi:hypothetical protein